MTDSNVTELRKKLDALGIEHFDFDKGGRTQTMWESPTPDDMRHFCYETAANPAKTSRLTISWFPTPDQAIAATLGSERERALEELLDRWHSFAIGNGLDQSCADYEEWCALERATLEQLGR